MGPTSQILLLALADLGTHDRYFLLSCWQIRSVNIAALPVGVGGYKVSTCRLMLSDLADLEWNVAALPDRSGRALLPVNVVALPLLGRVRPIGRKCRGKR